MYLVPFLLIYFTFLLYYQTEGQDEPYNLIDGEVSVESPTSATDGFSKLLVGLIN